MQLRGRAAFGRITNGYLGLKIIDLSDSSSPRVVATVPTDFPVKALGSVSIVQPYAYVASELLGIKIYDVSDPLNLRLVRSYNKPNGYVQTNAIAARAILRT